MKTMICIECRDYGQPAKKKRGSNGVAIGAWLVFPIGIPYTIWRMSTKIPVCKKCGSENLVDTESAAGVRLMAMIIGEADEDGEPIIYEKPEIEEQAVEAVPQEEPTQLQNQQKKRKQRPDEW